MKDLPSGRFLCGVPCIGSGEEYWPVNENNCWQPGAGAGLAAAFAAPLASSLLVIESIERFDAPKTAITTLLAGVVAGGVASMIFPINPYFQIDAISPGLTFFSQVKLFLLLAAVISVSGKIYSVITVWFKRLYPAIKYPAYVKMLYLLFIAYLISLTEVI